MEKYFDVSINSSTQILFLLYIITIISYTFIITRKLRYVAMEDNSTNALLQVYTNTINLLNQKVSQLISYAIQYTLICVTLLSIVCSKSDKIAGLIALTIIPVVALLYCILIDEKFKEYDELRMYNALELEPKISKSCKNLKMPEIYMLTLHKKTGDKSEGTKRMFFNLITCFIIIGTFWIQFFLFEGAWWYIGYVVVCEVVLFFITNKYIKYTKQRNEIINRDYK